MRGRGERVEGGGEEQEQWPQQWDGVWTAGMSAAWHAAPVFLQSASLRSTTTCATSLCLPVPLNNPCAPVMQVSVMQLLAVSRLMNQAVGDALSGLLLCDAVLRSGTSLADWQWLYQDLPSRQLKLVVADRTAITTTDAERKCVTPAGEVVWFE